MAPLRTVLVAASVFVSGGVAQSDPVLYGIGNGTADNSSNLYRVDDYATSPSAFDIGETGRIFLDIAIGAAGDTGYGIASDGVFYSINLATAEISTISVAPGGNLNALESLADGTLLAWGSTNTFIYEVNPATGVFTPLFDVGFASGGDLAQDLNGDLYGATSTQLIRIDLDAQSATLVGGFGIQGAFGLEVDVDGTMYMMRGADGSGTADLYTVNKATGAASLIDTVANASSLGCYGIGFAPVEAGCDPDFNNDGMVDAADLAALLAAWGACGDCDEDLDGSGDVGAADLATLLAAWGPC